MKTNQRLSKRFNTGLIAVVMLLGCSAAFAQVKIGANPTVINPTSNLEVEASTTGRKTSIDKTTGQVTIKDGTEGTGKLLTSDANGGASWQAVGVQDSPVLFYVANSTNQTSVTGATDVANFGTTLFDKGTNFNLSTDTFTVPANGTGIYQFNTVLGITNQAYAQGVYIMLQVNGGASYMLAIANCAAGAGVGGGGSLLVSLSAGDTVKMIINPSLQPGQSSTFFHIGLSAAMVSR